MDVISGPWLDARLKMLHGVCLSGAVGRVDGYSAFAGRFFLRVAAGRLKKTRFARLSVEEEVLLSLRLDQDDRAHVFFPMRGGPPATVARVDSLIGAPLDGGLEVPNRVHPMGLSRVSRCGPSARPRVRIGRPFRARRLLHYVPRARPLRRAAPWAILGRPFGAGAPRGNVRPNEGPDLYQAAPSEGGSWRSASRTGEDRPPLQGGWGSRSRSQGSPA